ncbi:LPS export ABC transporter periplasmic protein LptC [Pseudomonas sp. 5P_3.1_Bac2]|uniref:LPS export ABC transporter periplasmic protein LptC n=1 Tax=Pseudomonas sp. 5P_3.1_Bac2 TaxID=2971617 RepID=UPI0021C73781|nr:LPS export ABC transporter periplasmic protein LptC [Pseudomonas sp. 5P_3.1_Bac2]MCU1715647.1 LPS export ABC transporter periplasmic protein LptC [Pseudomonas sp. 5P_3.1_Bac2]
MPRKLTQSILLTLAVALLIALGYWNLRPSSFDEAPAQDNAASLIDFYAENTYTIEFQEDGKLNYELNASKVEHLKASDVTLVTAPDMDMYRGKESPWKIRSLRAEVSPGGTEVELIDQVSIKRADAKGNPTELTTSRLTVFPDKDYAQTQQAVKIDTAEGVTTAVGMKAYLNDSRMLLLSNVRGQHEAR